MVLTNSSEDIAIIRLAPSFEAFGLVLDLLASTEPFRSFDLETLSAAIKRQLADSHNLAAMQGDRIVGYAGWILTTSADGAEWVENRRRIHPIAEEDADAAALTVFASEDAGATKRLIRGARELNKGKRVFFKRSYDGYVKQGRKSEVLNFSGDPQIKQTE